MLLFLGLLARAIIAALRPRTHLVLVNLALRQQLAVLKRKRQRPRVSRIGRLFWLLLRRCWSRWADALIIVKPETVVRWHRAGFRAYWRWKSRRPERPRIDREVRDLIREMARENRWSAPRIYAELVELGFKVSERTVSRYMPKRPADPDAIQRWRTFLRNHGEVLAGMDFFTVATVTFTSSSPTRTTYADCFETTSITTIEIAATCRWRRTCPSRGQSSRGRRRPPGSSPYRASAGSTTAMPGATIGDSRPDDTWRDWSSRTPCRR